MNTDEHGGVCAPYQPPAGAPRWFLDNIAQPGDSHYVDGEGGRVHFLSWHLEDHSRPTLVFVHGFGGHAHWWSFLAPFFADTYRVVALDLPGMGDSDHLAAYDDESFARGILAVVRQYGLGPATLVGHSFGGIQSMYAMTLAPELFARGIVIDCNLRFPQQRPAGVEIPPLRDHRRRPSREACMDKFTLTPAQPEALEFLLHYVAWHSCTRDGEGWHWKFDYMTRSANMITDPNLLTRIPLRVDCIFGGRSIYHKPDLEEVCHRCFPNFGRLEVVPDAWHHLAMDHPLELVKAIGRLLAE